MSIADTIRQLSELTADSERSARVNGEVVRRANKIGDTIYLDAGLSDEHEVAVTMSALLRSVAALIMAIAPPENRGVAITLAQKASAYLVGAVEGAVEGAGE